MNKRPAGRTKTQHTENAWASDLPTGLSDETQQQLVEQFLVGDFSNRNYFILAYTRMAISIGSRFKRSDDPLAEDSVGEALAALCELPNEIHGGKMRTDIYPLVNLVDYYIRGRCLVFRRTDHLVLIPHRTMSRKKMQPFTQVSHVTKKCVDHEDDMLEFESILDNLEEPEHLNYMPPAEMLDACNTVGHQKVLTMLWQGHRLCEIAQALHFTEGWVRKQIKQMKDRIDESLLALDAKHTY